MPEEKFKQFVQPSRKFLHFEEQLLTEKNADQNHWKTVSYNNCMVRVPWSLNSNQVRFDERGEIVDIPTEAESWSDIISSPALVERYLPMLSIFKDEMFLIFVMISRSRLWFGHNIRLKSSLFFSFSISTYRITWWPTRLHEMVDLKSPTRNVSSSIMKEISSGIIATRRLVFCIYLYRRFFRIK